MRYALRRKPPPQGSERRTLPAMFRRPKQSESQYASRFTPRWIIESTYFVDGYVTFSVNGRPVERAKVTSISESGFSYIDESEAEANVSWDEVDVARYFQPIRRIGEMRGPGDVTWVDDEKLWPCEHCAAGDHVPCPAPHGGLGLCCCDEAPIQMTLEYLDGMRKIGVEFGMALFQTQESADLLELAASRGWTRRY